MQAWVRDARGSIETLRLGVLPKPEPAADQVLVRIRAACLNPADLEVLSGGRPARFIHARRDPLIAGSDLSGIVVGVGESAQRFRVGDEVFGFLSQARTTERGTLAEYVNVFPMEIRPKPANLSHQEAACAATAGTTAMNALRRSGQLLAGRRVLINGASGGVGSFATQIAVAHGAEVWATCSGSNVDFVRRLGAHRVFEYAVTDPLRQERRFHAVIDVGDTLSFRIVERRLRTGGAYVAMLPSIRFFKGVLSSMLSSRSCRLARASHAPDDFDGIIRLLTTRRVRTQIQASYSMADVPAALRLLRDESVRGRIAVVVSEY